MLTGRWIGRFSYDRVVAVKPVPFDMALTELAGSLIGTSTEPNSFRSEPYLSVSATLTGWRKTYTAFDQGDSPGLFRRREPGRDADHGHMVLSVPSGIHRYLFHGPCAHRQRLPNTTKKGNRAIFQPLDAFTV